MLHRLRQPDDALDSLTEDINVVDVASQAPVAGLPESAKVLLVANTAWYLHNFRGGLITELLSQDLDVATVCPWDEYVEQLHALGARWIEWPCQRKGTNPLSELHAVRRLARIYQRESPNLVHHFTIKAILYGTLAAKRTRVPTIVNNVTGLGHVFLSHGLKAGIIRAIIRPLYSWALGSRNVQPIFQNPDDYAEFARWNRKLNGRALQTCGSGVNLSRFAPRTVTEDRHEPLTRVLFIGRLLAEKGIYEYVEAARICQTRGCDALFEVCGRPDPGNPSSVDGSTLETWYKDDTVEFLGHVNGIEDTLAQADLIVLPSYREGTPKVLMEAAAMGKPVVATDVPGCRQAVIDGETGLLVPPRDPVALADAIQDLIGSPQLRKRMGEASRHLARARFDERRVNNITMGAYRTLWKQHLANQPPTTPVKLSRGALVISLDLELAWGTRGRPLASRVPPFLDGTREAIRNLLQIFEQYDVGATWAFVGALLLGQGKKGERHPWLSDEAFGDVPIGDAVTHPHWYGEDILESLVACPVPQEMGCHTLTHLFVDGSPVGREPFRQELARFLHLMDDLYLERPRSFIYPKAHMGHFDVLAEMGFRSFRGPEPKWFERLPGRIPSAACRMVDARLGLSPNVQDPQLLSTDVWMVPSSQFYSPKLSVGKHVSVEARVRKAIKGLHLAAKQRKVFHLWTHPFNLGVETGQLIDGLRQIMAEAAKLREAGLLDVVTMGDLSAELDRLNSE